MSDQQSDTGNSMDAFTTLLHMLEGAPDPAAFDFLISKLIEIDRHSTILYFRKNRDNFPPDYMAVADAWLGKWL